MTKIRWVFYLLFGPAAELVLCYNDEEKIIVKEDIMAFVEKTISSEIVYDGPIFKVRKHQVESVNGPAVRDVVEHNGGAIMLAVTDEGKILMERQFRKPLEKVILELPAGKIDPGEDPAVCAARELEEETGYKATSVRHLVTYYPTCGYSAEALYIYICKNLVKGERHLDPTEDLDVLEYDAEELIEMIMNGEICDSKTIIGVLYARQAGEI